MGWRHERAMERRRLEQAKRGKTFELLFAPLPSEERRRQQPEERRASSKGMELGNDNEDLASSDGENRTRP